MLNILIFFAEPRKNTNRRWQTYNISPHVSLSREFVAPDHLGDAHEMVLCAPATAETDNTRFVKHPLEIHEGLLFQ